MRPGSANRSPALAILGLFVLGLAIHAAIVATAAPPPGIERVSRLGLVAAAALMHWCLYASLLATFALTLRPGREALITAMARRLHGEISPELACYTRRVTLAWSLFFAAQLLLSVGLFCLAPLVDWSFFVNVLDLPLVAAMFLCEFLIRLRVLADPPRHSFAAMFDMVSDSVRQARARAPLDALPK